MSFNLLYPIRIQEIYMSNDVNGSTPLNAAQYLQKLLTGGEKPVIDNDKNTESVFNGIVQSYWSDNSLDDKTNTKTFSLYMADKLGQKDNQECLDIINQALRDINGVDGNFNLSEEDFKDDEDYYSKLTRRDYLKNASSDEIAQDIKDIVSSPNPNKEDLLYIIRNSGTEIFEVMNKFSPSGENSICGLIGSNFPPESAKEIMYAMGVRASSDMYDRIDWGSERDRKPLDWISIDRYLMSGLYSTTPKDENMLEFARGFLSSSGSIRNEIINRYGSSQWQQLTKSVAQSEQKADSLQNEYYNNKIKEHDSIVNKAEGNVMFSHLIESTENLCYSGAFYNSLVSSGPQGKELADRLIENTGNGYYVNFGNEKEFISNEDVYKNLQTGKLSNATVMKLAMERKFPEGTNITGAGAMGGQNSEYAGNLKLMMSLIGSDAQVETYERKGLFQNRTINGILNILADPTSETIAMVSFYSEGNPETSKLKDYRDNEIVYEVADKNPHSLSVIGANDKYVKLVDPNYPNVIITITREEFCAKAQYIEYCTLASIKKTT